jgi:hypothetical protein
VEEPERTVVGAGEEHLLNVGVSRDQGIVIIFVVTELAIRLPGAEGRGKLDTAFIESQRMPEVRNIIVRAAEW